MSQKVGEIYYDVTLNTGSMIDGQRKVQRELDSTTRSLDSFKSKLTQVASAVSAYAAALFLIQQSDAFTKMNAQLKLATDSTRELAIAQADVKRIAQETQADISAVAMLYAKVSSSTKELGLAQKTAAEITRTVSLALKVSGASAAESGSAIMQLGQAFASGALRGDEFNSVNEAAPRLMKALADGIGVPVGQLRAMAEAGKLTSEVLATALPKALKDLEAEAKQIQTISGAFQELKNEVMLFVGEQSTASGAAQAVAGSISALTNNLGLLAGVLATVAAVKFALWLESIVTQAYATVAANAAMRASTVAAAEAQVVATAATSALASARVAELRSAVMAAEGNVALAVTTNGLIPAQARAAVAAEAHAVALGALSVAQRAASVSGTAVAGVMSLLGGPIGAITAVLGLGATAWMLWGKSADDASKQAEGAIEASGREIIASLDKQNAKLRERLALAKAGNVDAAKSGSKDAERLASTLAEINALKAKGAALTGSDKIQLAELEGRYRDISAALATNKGLTEEIAAAGQQSKASEWATKYATDLERVNAEIAKAKKELGAAFTPELEQRIRAKIIPPKKAAAEKKTADAKFDDAGYLASLKKNAVDAWQAVTDAETEATRKNDKLLADKKISHETHERAKTIITHDANVARQKIMADDTDKYLKDASQKYEAEQQIKERAMQYGAGITKAINPVDALRQEYQAKLEIVTQYEQMMAKAGVDATEQGQMARTQITNEYELQRTALAEQSFRAQGASQAFLMDSINAFSSSASSAIMGLINGTMTAQDAMRNLAGVVLNEAVSALVQIGVQQVKNALLGNTLAAADAARKAANGAVYSASVAAQVAGMTALAGQNAFAATAAIPIVGPGLAPAAAAAAMAASAGLGAPAIATAPIAGARQYGGVANAGNLYRVNEKGPEMFVAGNGSQYLMPTQSGRVTPSDQVGGSVKMSITIINSHPTAQVSTQTDETGRTAQIIIAEVANQISNNSGPVWSALRGASNVTGRM